MSWRHSGEPAQSSLAILRDSWPSRTSKPVPWEGLARLFVKTWPPSWRRSTLLWKPYRPGRPPEPLLGGGNPAEWVRVWAGYSIRKTGSSPCRSRARRQGRARFAGRLRRGLTSPRGSAPLSAMDFDAQVRREAMDRGVEVHGEATPPRNAVVTRRAGAQRRRRERLDDGGPTWLCPPRYARRAAKRSTPALPPHPTFSLELQAKTASRLPPWKKSLDKTWLYVLSMFSEG
jgi:hypothetical protein